MPTALSVGTTTFREISREGDFSSTEFGTVVITRKGAASGLANELNSHILGSSLSGYPLLILDTVSFKDQGPVSEVRLVYKGIAVTRTGGGGFELLSQEDYLNIQTAVLLTDEDEEVTFSYWSQVSTYRWRSISKPSSPRFRKSPSREYPTEELFNATPAKYEGTIEGRLENVMKLDQFHMIQTAGGPWEVTETWMSVIRPIES